MLKIHSILSKKKVINSLAVLKHVHQMALPTYKLHDIRGVNSAKRRLCFRRRRLNLEGGDRCLVGEGGLISRVHDGSVFVGGSATERIVLEPLDLYTSLADYF